MCLCLMYWITNHTNLVPNINLRFTKHSRFFPIISLDFGYDEDSQKTPLTHAVSKGNLKSVENLLNSGADANQKDDSGSTPLIQAMERSDVEMITVLSRHGANLNYDIT